MRSHGVDIFTLLMSEGTEMSGDEADSLPGGEWKLRIHGEEEGSGSLLLAEPPWTFCF